MNLGFKPEHWMEKKKEMVPDLKSAPELQRRQIECPFSSDKSDQTWLTVKIEKTVRAWWRMPVIPATWEAEPRELLEPGTWKLQWAEIVPLYSSLGDRVEKKEKKKRNWSIKNQGSKRV